MVAEGGLIVQKGEADRLVFPNGVLARFEGASEDGDGDLKEIRMLR